MVLDSKIPKAVPSSLLNYIVHSFFYLFSRLKDATVDNSQWTAEIVPEAEEGSKNQMGMRITSCYEDLDKQLVMQRILGKDLEVLLHSVMHLENHPMARGRD